MKKTLIPGKVDYCIFDRSFADSTSNYARYKYNDPATLAGVQKNRSAVASIYGRQDVVTLKQVHGTQILIAAGSHMTDDEVAADGMITAEKGLVLAIQTADCVPLLLAAADGSVVAALHCGWRSSRAGIIAKAIEKFEQTYAVKASDLQAVIGPAIMQQSYEVDDAFYLDFLAEKPENAAYFVATDNDDKFLFDLPAYVKGMLDEQGVNLHTHIAEDTYSNAKKYPSRRRSFHKNAQYSGNILSTIAITQ